MARMAVLRSNVYGHNLFVSDCWKCGVVFAIPVEMEETRRQDGEPIYCPNGHSGRFSTEESWESRQVREAKELVARAEADRDRAQRAREWAEKVARGANISAGKARAARARVEHRVACGVCPECHRSFKQLAAHMAMKHGTPAERRAAIERQPRKRR